MGCDIHSWAEVKRDGKWCRVTEKLFSDWGDHTTSEPFGCRSYGVFAFLAGVRIYSHVPVLVEPRGLPTDSDWLNGVSKYAYENNPMSGEIIPYEERETNKRDIENDPNYHTHSWISLQELMDFDYGQKFENRRISETVIASGGTTIIDGSAEAQQGHGKELTYREFLGKGFFEHLFQLQTMGLPADVRIIFYFDN